MPSACLRTTDGILDTSEGLNRKHKMSDLRFFILFKGITPLLSGLLPFLPIREDSQASSKPHFYTHDGDILGLLSIRPDPFSQIESHSETIA